jgi:L-ascorbate metabolism protein UlaG (beta-lactamase superfamily)
MYAIPDKYRRPYSAPPPTDGDRLILRWFGTAGFELSYRNTTLLIDPYFTRTDLVSTGLKHLSPNPAEFDGRLGRADHIVLGHSHYDHLLDVPEIALRTGALITGSATTANISRGYGVPPRQLRTVRAGESAACGDLRVTFIESLHGKIFGIEPTPGTVDAPPRWPMKMAGFKHGGVFGLLIEAGPLTIYHNGSANLIDDRLAGKRVDLHLIGLSGRTMTRNYLPRFISALKPLAVLPMHYDNFFMPLKDGLKLLPFIKMEKFFRQVEELESGIKIVMPNLMEKVTLWKDGENLEICLGS